MQEMARSLRLLHYITPSFRKSLKFFGTSIASLDPETVQLPAFSILSAMFTGASGPPEQLSLASAQQSSVLRMMWKSLMKQLWRYHKPFLYHDPICLPLAGSVCGRVESIWQGHSGPQCFLVPWAPSGEALVSSGVPRRRRPTWGKRSHCCYRSRLIGCDRYSDIPRRHSQNGVRNSKWHQSKNALQFAVATPKRFEGVRHSGSGYEIATHVNSPLSQSCAVARSEKKNLVGHLVKMKTESNLAYNQ